MNPTTKLLTLLLLFLLSLNETLNADEPQRQSATETKWPEQFVVEVGDIRTRINGPKMWTLSGIDFRNSVMATEDSAYGSVLVIRGAGLLGTAHFLDVPGRPGEVEKENVSSLTWMIDDKPVESLPPSMKLTGNSFRLQRESSIRSVRLSTTITLERDLLTETIHFKADNSLDLQCVYPWMYAWNKDASAYIFGDNRSVVKRGDFRKSGDVKTEIIKDATWMAVYNAESKLGSVCCSLQHPSNTDLWFLLIDAPEAYRKIIGYSLEDKIIDSTFSGTYQVAVSFFSADSGEWESVAIEQATQIRRSALSR